MTLEGQTGEFSLEAEEKEADCAGHGRGGQDWLGPLRLEAPELAHGLRGLRKKGLIKRGKSMPSSGHCAD